MPAKPKNTPSKPAGDRVFLLSLQSLRLPVAEPEYRFCPDRNWRVDYAWPDYRLALEVEGGVWTQGRHNRGSGFMKDMEKYNRLAALGWRLIRCTPTTLRTKATFDLISEALSHVI